MPGKYSVTAAHPELIMPGFESEGVSETVPSRGCTVIDVVLRKRWPGSISGRLIRPDGTAPAGIDVNLIRLTGTGTEQESHYVLSEGHKTNEQGEYEFRGIVPGRYMLVLHPCCFPTPEAPYPAIYWPQAATEAAGAEIEVPNASVFNRYDFQLPPEVKSRVVHGIVRYAGGEPAAGARVRILRLPDNAGTGDDILCDADGQFSFKAFDGLEYSVDAMGATEPLMKSSEQVVSTNTGWSAFTLVLNIPE